LSSKLLNYQYNKLPCTYVTKEQGEPSCQWECVEASILAWHDDNPPICAGSCWSFGPLQTKFQTPSCWFFFLQNSKLNRPNLIKVCFFFNSNFHENVFYIHHQALNVHPTVRPHYSGHFGAWHNYPL
jgi:hypothetical protein